MKKISLFVLMLGNFSFCFSQTYYLNVKLRDGTEVKYSVANINKIDFNGITNIKDKKKIDHIIKIFKLLKNYPNPFNPSTTIEYEIPKAGKVQISVYDLRGRLIKSLLNSFQQTGIHKIKWDGTNNFGKKVGSGLYVYNVKYGNKMASKKMVLLK